MVEKQSWFTRRHSYRPEAIGLTEPVVEPVVPLPITSVPIPAGSYQSEQLLSQLINKIDRSNVLLEDLLDIQYHNSITDEDIDVSDSATYTLAAGEAVIVSYKIPDDYVLLIREFNTSLFYDSSYYAYLDDEIFQYTSDMEFPGAGLPIESGITFKMYILNTHPASQEYTTTINASLRRNINWRYSRRSYRIPV